MLAPTHADRVALAAHILDLATRRGTLFGDRKVYLATIPGWDRNDAELLATLDTMRRERLLQFSRADFVAAMPPELVAASEWRLDGASYHFLCIA
jgi:hypothetical protein